MNSDFSSPDSPSGFDRKVKILLVDDQPANLLALQVILEGLGQNLVEAHSGEEALRRLLHDDFAVVLLDVVMPGIDGYETARRIRGRERNRHTPVIFLTAHDCDRQTLEQGYALGAVDFLVKPLVPAILKAKVSQFIDLFQKTEQVKWQAEQLRQMERREFERRLAEEGKRQSERADDTIRRSEQELADFFENAAIGLHWVGPDGTILRANRAELDLLGYAPEEYIGHPIAEFHADPDVIQDILRRLQAGETLHGYEARVRCKDGSIKHVLIDSNVFQEDGRFIHTRCFTRDITQRKRLEEELQARVKELGEADRRKNEFLAMLAHELRNPLAPIRNAVQFLRLRGPDEPDLRSVSEMLDRQLRQLVRLVDDLLDLTRISTGKMKLEREPVDLAAVVGRAVETCRPFLEARKQLLSVSTPDEPVWVEADPARLVQVFTNLLNNAAKYSDQGRPIWLAVRREGGNAVVRVRDRGVGISAEMLPRIFGLFTQVESSLNRSEGGLGIGLTLVRTLIEMHGGSVEAVSDGPGRGSEFIVRLPLAEVKEGNSDPMQERGSDSSPGRRILVVDDSVDAADSLALLLRLAGHEVRTAHDGLTALKTADGSQPEVVLLDIGLPGMDGYEVAQRLRQEGWSDRACLVAVTGYGQEEDRHRSQEAGFDYHLVKPVDLDELQELVQRLRK